MFQNILLNKGFGFLRTYPVYYLNIGNIYENVGLRRIYYMKNLKVLQNNKQCICEKSREFSVEHKLKNYDENELSNNKSSAQMRNDIKKKPAYTKPTYEVFDVSDKNKDQYEKLLELNLLNRSASKNSSIQNHQDNYNYLNLVKPSKGLNIYSDVQAVTSKNLLKCTSDVPKKSKEELDRDDKKNRKLMVVYHLIQKYFPKAMQNTMMVGPINSKDITFDNRITGKITQGLLRYHNQYVFLIIAANCQFVNLVVDVRDISIDSEENAVKVRWKVSGYRAYKVLLGFFALKVKSKIDVEKLRETWHEGLSTFYVGSDGLIYKHVMDNMITDRGEPAKRTVATRLAQLIERKTSPVH